MKYLRLCFFLTSTSLFFSGCAGVMINSMDRSSQTGETFDELAKVLTTPEEGMGRLFIYRTKASTKRTLSYGIGIIKNWAVCKLDRDSIALIWEAFSYLDLPAGEHTLACISIFFPGIPIKANPTIEKSHYVTITIPENSSAFIRLDVTDDAGRALSPISMNDHEASIEIKDLVFDKTAHVEFHGSIKHENTVSSEATLSNQLTASQIKEQFTNRIVKGRHMRRGFSFTRHFQPNGKIVGKNPFKGERTGHWSVEGDLLCISWKKGMKRCGKLFKENTSINLYKASGTGNGILAVSYEEFTEVGE